MRKSSAPSRKQSKDNSASQGGSAKAGEKQETQQALISSTKFIVCYGKVTSRKQKIFSDDGTLEISGGNAVLRDAQGKIVGSTQLKIGVDEASTLRIRGMEVQVVSRILEELSSCDKTVDYEENPAKKFKEMIRYEAPSFTIEIPADTSNISEDVSSSKASSSVPLNQSESDDELISYDDKPEEKIDFEQPQTNEETKVFTVCYAKSSSKLHKVYDRDGTLEVCDKKAVLKDSNQKIIGSTNLKKEVEEGTKLQMSGKDIEIVERVANT